MVAVTAAATISAEPIGIWANVLRINDDHLGDR
jgi:hypothetical protein